MFTCTLSQVFLTLILTGWHSHNMSFSIKISGPCAVLCQDVSGTVVRTMVVNIKAQAAAVTGSCTQNRIYKGGGKVKAQPGTVVSHCLFMFPWLLTKRHRMFLWIPENYFRWWTLWPNRETLKVSFPGHVKWSILFLWNFNKVLSNFCSSTHPS